MQQTLSLFTHLAWPWPLSAGLLLGMLAMLWTPWYFQRRAKRELATETSARQVLEAQYREQLHEKELALARLQASYESVQAQLSQVQQDNQTLEHVRADYLKVNTRLEEQQKALKSEQNLLEQTKKSLFNEFETATAKLFEDKQKNFVQQSRTNLETVLNPFKDSLKDFNKRVEDIYHKENTQRNQLVGQINELQKQAKQISSEANNLASALKGDNKAQGNWGEIILERLLEQSGLEKGREYETQLSFTDEAGKQKKPDVIVRLPEGKDIVIDAKVSLVAYEQYSNAEQESNRETALRAHVDSLRSHIRNLSIKQYEHLPDIRTLDFVFIFVPIEAAYVAAIQHSPSLFKEAYDKNIVLVSPSSLIVALRTVETIWRYEKQNANAEKIAASAGKLYDQFVLALEAFEEVGGYIDKAAKSYDKTLKRFSEGRGNLVGKIENLRKLGAKTSRNLPNQVATDTDEHEASDNETNQEAKVE